LFRKRF